MSTLSIKPPYQILNIGGRSQLGTPILTIADMTEECYPFGNVPEHYRDVAEFMVNASNLHDELVAALETLIESTTQPTGPTLRDAVAGAREVLARVRGGVPS